MSVSRKEIALVIRALKAVDSATLQRLADEVGVAERTLWHYRSGKTKPTASRARVLARALGLPKASDGRAS